MIGKAIGSPVKEFINEVNTKGVNVEYIGVVEGEKISKTYYNIRYASYKSSPLYYENPKESAWESIVLEILEKNFARENDLLPSSQEIKKYTEYTRSVFEKDEDGEILVESMLSGMNMSIEEYWEYHEKYLAPTALTHYKVQAYIQEHNLPELKIENAVHYITDIEYYDKL